MILKGDCSIIFNDNGSTIIIGFFNVNNYAIVRKEIGDGVGPFDDDDVGRVIEAFVKIIEHETWI